MILHKWDPVTGSSFYFKEGQKLVLSRKEKRQIQRDKLKNKRHGR